MNFGKLLSHIERMGAPGRPSPGAFEKLITEAFQNYDYEFPTTDNGHEDVEKMMYDFYVIACLPYWEFDVDALKEKYGADFDYDDKIKTIYYNLMEARRKNFEGLKKHLLSAVFFSICAETRHISDRNDDKAIKKFFSKYPGGMVFIENYLEATSQSQTLSPKIKKRVRAHKEMGDEESRIKSYKSVLHATKQKRTDIKTITVDGEDGDATIKAFKKANIDYTSLNDIQPTVSSDVTDSEISIIGRFLDSYENVTSAKYVRTGTFSGYAIESTDSLPDDITIQKGIVLHKNNHTTVNPNNHLYNYIVKKTIYPANAEFTIDTTDVGKVEKTLDAAKIRHGVSDMDSMSKEGFAKAMADAFVKLGWQSSYGGKPWSDICKGWVDLHNAQFGKDGAMMAAVIDHVYDLQHNTNTVFNKLKLYYKSGYDWIKDALDYKANIKQLYELMDKCQRTVANYASFILKQAQNTTKNSHYLIDNYTQENPRVVIRKEVRESAIEEEGEITRETIEALRKMFPSLNKDRIKINADGNLEVSTLIRSEFEHAQNDFIDNDGVRYTRIDKKIKTLTRKGAKEYVTVYEKEEPVDTDTVVVPGPSKEGTAKTSGIDDTTKQQVIEILNSKQQSSSGKIIQSGYDSSVDKFFIVYDDQKSFDAAPVTFDIENMDGYTVVLTLVDNYAAAGKSVGGWYAYAITPSKTMPALPTPPKGSAWEYTPETADRFPSYNIDSDKESIQIVIDSLNYEVDVGIFEGAKKINSHKTVFSKYKDIVDYINKWIPLDFEKARQALEDTTLKDVHIHDVKHIEDVVKKKIDDGDFDIAPNVSQKYGWDGKDSFFIMFADKTEVDMQKSFNIEPGVVAVQTKVVPKIPGYQAFYKLKIFKDKVKKQFKNVQSEDWQIIQPVLNSYIEAGKQNLHSPYSSMIECHFEDPGVVSVVYKNPVAADNFQDIYINNNYVLHLLNWVNMPLAKSPTAVKAVYKLKSDTEGKVELPTDVTHAILNYIENLENDDIIGYATTKDKTQYRLKFTSKDNFNSDIHANINIGDGISLHAVDDKENSTGSYDVIYDVSWPGKSDSKTTAETTEELKIGDKVEFVSGHNKGIKGTLHSKFNPPSIGGHVKTSEGTFYKFTNNSDLKKIKDSAQTILQHNGAHSSVHEKIPTAIMTRITEFIKTDIDNGNPDITYYGSADDGKQYFITFKNEEGYKKLETYISEMTVPNTDINLKAVETGHDDKGQVDVYFNVEWYDQDIKKETLAKGDNVQVIHKSSPLYGKTGKVESITNDEVTVNYGGALEYLLISDVVKINPGENKEPQTKSVSDNNKLFIDYFTNAQSKPQYGIVNFYHDYNYEDDTNYHVIFSNHNIAKAWNTIDLGKGDVSLTLDSTKTTTMGNIENVYKIQKKKISNDKKIVDKISEYIVDNLSDVVKNISVGDEPETYKITFKNPSDANSYSIIDIGDTGIVLKTISNNYGVVTYSISSDKSMDSKSNLEIDFDIYNKKILPKLQKMLEPFNKNKKDPYVEIIGWHYTTVEGNSGKLEIIFKNNFIANQLDTIHINPELEITRAGELVSAIPDNPAEGSIWYDFPEAVKAYYIIGRKEKTKNGVVTDSDVELVREFFNGYAKTSHAIKNHNPSVFTKDTYYVEMDPAYDIKDEFEITSTIKLKLLNSKSEQDNNGQYYNAVTYEIIKNDPAEKPMLKSKSSTIEAIYRKIDAYFKSMEFNVDKEKLKNTLENFNKIAIGYGGFDQDAHNWIVQISNPFHNIYDNISEYKQGMEVLDKNYTIIDYGEIELKDIEGIDEYIDTPTMFYVLKLRKGHGLNPEKKNNFSAKMMEHIQNKAKKTLSDIISHDMGISSDDVVIDVLKSDKLCFFAVKNRTKNNKTITHMELPHHKIKIDEDWSIIWHGTGDDDKAGYYRLVEEPL